MRLHNLKEGYSVLAPIDREKYQERDGLEGPIPTKSGKVVYYDPKAGQYYDPDTDMYISYDDWRMLDSENMHKMDVDEDFADEVDMRYAIIRYPDTAISYAMNDGSGWTHIYDKSYGFKGPVDKADLQHGKIIDVSKVPSRLREACSGGRKKRKMSEAGGYYTQPVYDMIEKHGYEKVMHELLTKLHADTIQDFLQRAELDESVNEAEKRWKQTSLSPQEATEKYGKENVKVKKGALRNGDDMVEVFVENEITEAPSEVHTVFINGKKWKSFYKKETADKAAATIAAKGKKTEVKSGPAPTYTPPKVDDKPRPPAKPNPAMDKALKSIEMSFGPERKAITDQVMAMVRTAEMLTNPRWADRAWGNVEQYGIKDKADLVRELQMMIADEQKVKDDDLDGHVYGPDSNIKQMRKALDKID
jgi:hypothetical protein